ncbi:MAG: DNA polymerase III subunit epsilon [Thiotrichaceae bacterium]|nr:DNA polymerase III subunit epsilon [Thiotrichaceae bacterium]
MNKNNATRQVVLDTETTGMNKGGPIHLGHRIIEIGCVEVINRRLTGRHFHVYINPEMEIDPEAIAVHGITDEFIQDKPTFDAVADEFIEFISGAELVIHNAPFDVSFMDQEFRFLNKITSPTRDIATILDTLVLAKKMFPAKRNNLDALADRYGINNEHRVLHGALLDAEILADVYLLMSGGQSNLNLLNEGQKEAITQRYAVSSSEPLLVIKATQQEEEAHHSQIEMLKKKGDCLWDG